jgi:hypothetical protein
MAFRRNRLIKEEMELDEEDLEELEEVMSLGHTEDIRRIEATTNLGGGGMKIDSHLRKPSGIGQRREAKAYAFSSLVKDK